VFIPASDRAPDTTSPEHSRRDAMRSPKCPGKMALVCKTCRDSGIDKRKPLFN
jgi:hypothetical protein